MKIIIIGNCGSGKSTLANQVQAVTGLPLLQLDSLWHSTDYSAKSKKWFINQQLMFMKQHEWIIEGNYGGTLKGRVSHADVIIWLKISRPKAIYRVIWRSLLFKIKRSNRPEMPANFSEHFNKEYFEFLKFICSYDENFVNKLIQSYKSPSCKVIIIKNMKEKSYCYRILSSITVFNNFI